MTLRSGILTSNGAKCRRYINGFRICARAMKAKWFQRLLEKSEIYHPKIPVAHGESTLLECDTKR